MKISGKETQLIDLEVDPKDVIQLTINMLQTDADLRENYYIKDGKVLKDEEHHTSHSYFVTEKVRDAVEKDHTVIEMVKYLQELKRRS